MKRYLTIFIVLFTFVIRVNAEDYKTGDLVSYKDIKFYVIEDHKDYVTLLKATPLTAEEVGGTYASVSYCQESNEICLFNNSNVKLILDKWSNDHLNSDDLIEADITYITHNNPTVVRSEDKLNDDYKNTTESYKVRLLTLKELTEKFGYKYTKDDYDNVTYDSSAKTPGWINNNEYWLMDNYLDVGYECVCTNYTRYCPPCASEEYYYQQHTAYIRYNNAYFGSSSSSLRPVINLSKKAEIKNLNSTVKKLTDKEFKIGDIVELNGIDFYVIKNSSKNEKKVTLLKATPLTVDEVNKYGVVDEVNYINKYTKESRKTAKDVGGYGAVAYYTSSDCGYDDSNNYKGSGCKYDYESSDLKQIIDNWSKSVLGLSNTDFGDNGFEARILTKDDLTNNLGYTYWYGTTWAYGYSPAEYSPDFMKQGYICWAQDKDYGTLAGSGGSYNVSGGIDTLHHVCPVITINKQVETNNKKLDNNNLNENNDKDNYTNNKVSIPNTLLKNPVFIIVVGIILIVIATVTVSLAVKRKK